MEKSMAGIPGALLPEANDVSDCVNPLDDGFGCAWDGPVA
jgi:hypothetical protein